MKADNSHFRKGADAVLAALLLFAPLSFAFGNESNSWKRFTKPTLSNECYFKDVIAGN